MNKSFIQNLLLMCGSLVFSVLLIYGAGEIYFRTVIGVDQIYGLPRLIVSDPDRGWALKPGAYQYFDPMAFNKVSFSINNFGLRNGPLSPRPVAGRQRVSIVGDSFTFSSALSNGETFTDRLQAIAGPGCEIVNISVPGYGTGQEMLLLDDLASKGYEVGNKLILVFFTNDILDNAGLEYAEAERNPYRPLFKVDAQGALQHERPLLAIPTPETGNKQSFSVFYDFLRSKAEALVANHPSSWTVLDRFGVAPKLPRAPGVITAYYSPGWEQRWQDTARILEYLVARTRHTGTTQVYIAFIPSPFQVETTFQKMLASRRAKESLYAMFLDDIDRPQRLLRGFCADHAVGFVDASAALRAGSRSANVYFPAEGHLNQRGSSIVADVLYRETMASAGP